MDKMTSIERVQNTLEHKPVDRMAFSLNPWEDTKKKWISQGYLKEDEDVLEHFGSDLRVGGWIESFANFDHKDVVLEETEDTILVLDGNGATLRRHKKHQGTPEHVDYVVKDMRTWQEHAKPHLMDLDRRRIWLDNYRDEKAFSAQHQRFLCWRGLGPFELMRSVCGHENMLMGMALDPDWIKDMVMTYVDFTIRHMEVAFAEHGSPDGVFMYDDMGYKGKPFMSPAMYKDIMQPGHKRLFDFVHSLGCKVIVHSCGYVEPLVPGMIEAGMDCLQVMEVKAGMNLPELFKKFGDKISFFGGVDTRALISNDYAQIDSQLQQMVLPVVKGGGGYILHSDHSEPPEVEYETMKYFIEAGKRLTR